MHTLKKGKSNHFKVDSVKATEKSYLNIKLYVWPTLSRSMAQTVTEAWVMHIFPFDPAMWLSGCRLYNIQYIAVDTSFWLPLLQILSFLKLFLRRSACFMFLKLSKKLVVLATLACEQTPIAVILAWAFKQFAIAACRLNAVELSPSLEKTFVCFSTCCSIILWCNNAFVMGQCIRTA